VGVPIRGKIFSVKTVPILRVVYLISKPLKPRAPISKWVLQPIKEVKTPKKHKAEGKRKVFLSCVTNGMSLVEGSHLAPVTDRLRESGYTKKASACADYGKRNGMSSIN
jgi:hypothetical protein